MTEPTHTPMTEEEIERDLDICERATEGPWEDHSTCDSLCGPGLDIRDPDGEPVFYVNTHGEIMAEMADCHFTAKAREGWPRALREIQRLRKVLGEK